MSTVKTATHHAEGYLRGSQGLPWDAEDESSPPHEDSAGSVHHVGFDARGDQPHDLILQQLPVPGSIFIPDHQIHAESLQAPISVSLYQLAYQVEIREVTYLQ